MKKTMILAIALALAAATPALARSHHHHQAKAGNPPASSPIDSGYGPPANWNEIEISGPSGE